MPAISAAFIGLDRDKRLSGGFFSVARLKLLLLLMLLLNGARHNMFQPIESIVLSEVFQLIRLIMFFL